MPAIPLATFSPNFTSQSTAAHNHRPSSFLPFFLPCSVFYLHSFLLAPGQVYVVNFRGKFPILAFPKLIALCYCLDSVAQNPKEFTWQCQTSLGGPEHRAGSTHTSYMAIFCSQKFTAPDRETLQDKWPGFFRKWVVGGMGGQKDKDKGGTYGWRKTKETYQPIIMHEPYLDFDFTVFQENTVMFMIYMRLLETRKPTEYLIILRKCSCYL